MPLLSVKNSFFPRSVSRRLLFENEFSVRLESLHVIFRRRNRGLPGETAVPRLGPGRNSPVWISSKTAGDAAPSLKWFPLARDETVFPFFFHFS